MLSKLRRVWIPLQPSALAEKVALSLSLGIYCTAWFIIFIINSIGPSLWSAFPSENYSWDLKAVLSLPTRNILFQLCSFTTVLFCERPMKYYSMHHTVYDPTTRYFIIWREPVGTFEHFSRISSFILFYYPPNCLPLTFKSYCVLLPTAFLPNGIQLEINSTSHSHCIFLRSHS